MMGDNSAYQSALSRFQKIHQTLSRAEAAVSSISGGQPTTTKHTEELFSPSHSEGEEEVEFHSYDPSEERVSTPRLGGRPTTPPPLHPKTLDPEPQRVQKFSSSMLDMFDSLIAVPTPAPSNKPSPMVVHENKELADEEDLLPQEYALATSRKQQTTVGATRTPVAGGSTYTLRWTTGLLGLRIKKNKSKGPFPYVTKLTGKSSVIGIHLVDMDDFLIRIDDHDTRPMSFDQAIECMRMAPKPCKLEFQRASPTSSHPTFVKNSSTPLRSALALKIAQKIKELQEEERRNAPVPLEPLLSAKYSVQWLHGALGLSLIANNDAKLPQVTKIMGRQKNTTSSDLSQVLPGHFLIQIGDLHTSETNFDLAIQHLQKVKKPVTLIFCPNSRQQSQPSSGNPLNTTPSMNENEYEISADKKNTLAFTMKEGKNGAVLVGDVTPSGRVLPNHRPKGSKINDIKTNDVVIAVDDTNVEGLAFREVLRKIRQNKKTLVVRLRRDTGHFKSSAAPSAASPKIKSRITKFFSRKERQTQSSPALLVPEAVTSNKEQPIPPVPKIPVSQAHSLRAKTSSPPRPPTLNSSPRKRSLSHGSKVPKGRASLPKSPVTGEFEVTWQEHTRLGLALKPHGEKKIPMVVRLTGTSSSPEIKKVQAGDLLVLVNGSPLNRHDDDFRLTLEELSKVKKPALLRFRRNDPSVIAAHLEAEMKSADKKAPATNSATASSNSSSSSASSPRTPRAAAATTAISSAKTTNSKSSSAGNNTNPDSRLKTDSSQEYQYNWKKKKLVGFMFAADPQTKLPVVSKADVSKDPTCTIVAGDILIGIGNVTLLDKPFEASVKLLQSVSFPVHLRLRKGNK